MEGTLPIWSIILILGAGVLFALGYIKPYISKENKAQVIAYAKSENIGKPPVVIVRDHLTPAMSLALITGVALASLILFFVESFGKMVQHFGGGVLGFLITFGLVFLLYSFSFIALLFFHLIGETITSMSFERLYRDRFGLEVKYESDK